MKNTFFVLAALTISPVLLAEHDHHDHAHHDHHGHNEKSHTDESAHNHAHDHHDHGKTEVTNEFEQMHSHDSHVHGHVEMTIAVDAKQVNVSLTSPLMNLVGFEHAPKTEQQKQALIAAEDWFNHPQQWLAVIGGDCELTETNVALDQEHKGHNELHADYQFQCQSEQVTAAEIDLRKQFPDIEYITVDWLNGDKAGQQVLEGTNTAVTL